MTRYNYQRLRLDKNTGTYYNVKPEKVMIMQDPYNPCSYNTKITTVCAEPPSTNYKVLENYDKIKLKNKDKDSSYYLIEYK